MADKWLCIVLLVGLSVGLHGMKDPKPQCGRMEKGTPPDAFPWIVKSADGRFKTIATLIHESWVLTNTGIKVGDYVILGAHHPSSTQKIMVVDVIEHPNLPNGGPQMARLAHPVKFSKHVMPICLPKAGEALPAGSNWYTAGTPPDSSSKVGFKKYEL